MSASPKYPVGIKIIIGFHLLNILLWTIGQAGAVLWYDMIAEWGLQDPRALLDPAIVEVNRGIGLADMIIMIPLFIIATIGLWRMKFYGAITSWLAFGITLYWPVVFWCSQFFYRQAGIKHNPTEMFAILFPLLLMIFAIWASWYLYKNHNQLD